MKTAIKWTLLLIAGAIITALMVLGTASAQELQPIPAPSRVVDRTGTLTESQKKQLTNISSLKSADSSSSWSSSDFGGSSEGGGSDSSW